jgi:hypothetical protein
MVETNLFSITPSEDLDLFLESSDGVIESSTLYFTRPSKLHYDENSALIGSIELLYGSLEDGLDLLLVESVRIEVDLFGGYISDPIEEDCFRFSTTTTIDGVESTVTYVLISSGFGYCVQLKFLTGYIEEDVLEMCHVIAAANFKNLSGHASFGDVLNLEFSESQVKSLIGSRVILHSVD